MPPGRPAKDTSVFYAFGKPRKKETKRMIAVAALLVFLAASLVLSGIGAFAVRRLWSRPVPLARALPQLTVLKPLKGVDVGLYENLCSLATQRYPDFELLLGIEDPDDPAVEVALRVRREHPEVRVKVITGAPTVGMNPKVNNLMHMVRYARHDLTLISDSNVRVGPDYLSTLVAELADARVGLVHSVLVGTHVGGDGEQDRETLGSRLENLQMNTVTAYGVAGMAWLTGHPLVIGKSMLLRRSNLEQLGGFAAVSNVLAEDYVLGRRFEAAGFAVRLSPYRVGVINGGWSLTRFWNRQLRWSQMRRHLAPVAYLFEPSMCTLLWAAALVPAALSAQVPAPARAALLTLSLAAVCLRCWLDSAQVRYVRGTALSRRELAWLPFKELCMLLLWAIALVHRTVDWRGNQMRIGRGSALKPVEGPLTQQPAPPAPSRGG